MLNHSIARHIIRLIEHVALASLAISFSVHAARGQLPQTAAAAALVAKLSLAGLCFAYAKAREREVEAVARILRAGEAMLEAARHFMLAMAAQFLAEKAGLGDWPRVGPFVKVGIATFYLAAFAYFIRGFDLLGDELRRRRKHLAERSSAAELPTHAPNGRWISASGGVIGDRVEHPSSA